MFQAGPVTCGICEPEAFRVPIGVEPEKGRVFGYTCKTDPSPSVRSLYFHGAEHVFWDMPSNTNILKRPKLKRLLKICRPGDAIIFADRSDLGQLEPAQDRVFDHLKSLNLNFKVLRNHNH